jgi:hypothetical protein
MSLLTTQFIIYTLKLSLAFCCHFKYFQLEIIKKMIFSYNFLLPLLPSSCMCSVLHAAQLEPVSADQPRYSSAHNT